MSAPTFDLLVVGAGPAGAAAALAARQADPSARVGLVDRAAFPRDKVCGDGLTPATLAVLDELGVAHVLSGATAVRELEVTGPGGARLRAPLPTPGYVLARRTLDARLVDAAVARGAELIRARVTDVAPDGEGVVVNGRWSARCLIGADGANSAVRSRMGLARHPARNTGVAVRGYATAPGRPAGMDIRFAPGRLWPAYGWAFTSDDGTVNLGVGTFDATTSPTRSDLTLLLRSLFGDLRVDPPRLAGHRLPLSSGRPSLGTGPGLLAGDAAGLVDPVTGEGVHLALLSGMLAGRAAVTDPTDALSSYRRALGRRAGRRLRLLRGAARATRHPANLEALIAAAEYDDAAARATVAVALGAGDLSDWARVGLATLRGRLDGRAQPPTTLTTMEDARWTR